MADLTPRPGALVWLEPHEKAIIDALRADPSQEEHLVDVEWADNDMLDVTVRHPISERVIGDLFTCPVLEWAHAWLDDEEDPEGRWRLTNEAMLADGFREASFVRIDR